MFHIETIAHAQETRASVYNGVTQTVAKISLTGYSRSCLNCARELKLVGTQEQSHDFCFYCSLYIYIYYGFKHGLLH